jgi:hypothetical protein
LSALPGTYSICDEVGGIVASNIEYGDDIGVIECRGGLGLLHEAPLALRIGNFFPGKDFNGDKAIQVLVAGLIA